MVKKKTENIVEPKIQLPYKTAFVLYNIRTEKHKTKDGVINKLVECPAVISEVHPKEKNNSYPLLVNLILLDKGTVYQRPGLRIAENVSYGHGLENWHWPEIPGEISIKDVRS